VIKALKAQVGQLLLGCRGPVGRGIVLQEQDPFGEIPAAFFLQNVLNCASRDEQYSALMVLTFGR